MMMFDESVKLNVGAPLQSIMAFPDDCIYLIHITSESEICNPVDYQFKVMKRNMRTTFKHISFIWFEVFRVVHHVVMKGMFLSEVVSLTSIVWAICWCDTINGNIFGMTCRTTTAATKNEVDYAYVLKEAIYNYYCMLQAGDFNLVSNLYKHKTANGVN